jgi:hypothetical protein
MVMIMGITTISLMASDKGTIITMEGMKWGKVNFQMKDFLKTNLKIMIHSEKDQTIILDLMIIK